MEFLIVFVMIFSLSASLTIIMRKKIEQTIPISVMGIILFVYIFAIFEFLDIGVIFVTTISVLSLCYLINKIVKAKEEKNIKKLFSSIITPGFFIYVLFYVVFIIINYRAIFSNHDEFTHWGIIIKNMSINHSFGINEESIVQYCEYPPFTAIFQYIFLFFKGTYSESTIITASNILYLSIIITILSHIGWRKQLKKLILYIPTILFLPLICYINFYKEIIVDGIIGIFIFYVLYIWYTEKDNRLKKIGVTLGCCSIALTKLSGIGLSILVFLIGAVYDIYSTKNRKKELQILTIMIGTIIIFIMSWQLKLKITNAPQAWNLNNISVNSISEISENKQKNEIIKNFINNIFNTKVITNKNISTFLCFMILTVYSITQVIQITEKKEKQKYIYYNLALLLSSAIYIIALLLTYLFIIPEFESSSIPSFNRYMGTILLPIIMFNIIFEIERKEYHKNYEMIITIIILLIILPTTDITMKIVNLKKDDIEDLKERQIYAGIEKYKDVFTAQDKIYFMGNGSSDAYNAIIVDNYLAMPARIGNTKIYTTGHISIFKEIIKEGEYTHIYVFNLTEKYKDKFKEFFENEEIKNETLYKIEDNFKFYEVDI